MREPITVACVQAEPVVLDLDATIDKLDSRLLKSIMAAASEFDVETVISSTESIIGRMYMNIPSPPRLSWALMPSSVMLMA